jgi:multidrug resistance efflux pump
LTDQIWECCVTTDTVRAVAVVAGRRHRGAADGVALCEPQSRFYVQACFRETFVGNFQKGDRAVVTLMSYPDTPLQGSVDSIGWALPSKTVAPAVQNECTQLSSMKG